jgi:hypothetical protein
MERQIRYGRFVVPALVGLGIVACDSDNRTTPTVPTPAAVFIQRIDVAAPDTLAPGESAQLTATSVKSDGSTENVTATAVWASNNSRAISVAPGGRATANSPGEAVITARLQNRTGSKPVLAVPTGTYKLSGRITEGLLPVAGVSLRVTRGVGEGLTATSNFDGRFALYGLAGAVAVLASKEGYIDALRDLTVDSTMSDTFEIVPTRPRKNLAGTYSLSVTAGPCSASSGLFPAELRTRMYSATVTQSGQALTVTLHGATFVVSASRGDKFSGTIDPADNVTFSIGNFYYYYYLTSELLDLVERLDDSRSFSVVGVVTAKVNGSEVAGTLNGSFVVLQGTQPRLSIQSTCYSPSHTFVMRPR